MTELTEARLLELMCEAWAIEAESAGYEQMAQRYRKGRLRDSLRPRAAILARLIAEDWRPEPEVTWGDVWRTMCILERGRGMTDDLATICGSDITPAEALKRLKWEG